MKNFIIISFIMLAAWVAFCMYRAKLVKQVATGYNVEPATISDKSISELKKMIKALNNKS